LLLTAPYVVLPALLIWALIKATSGDEEVDDSGTLPRG
jgi:hypothetical protein